MLSPFLLRSFFWLGLCGAISVARWPADVFAHPPETHVRIATPAAEIAGTLLVPHSAENAAIEKVPCVLLIGGSLSHDRDGRTNRAGAPPRDALRRLAEAFAAGGYASLRFDPVGNGRSAARGDWRGTYSEQASVVAALVDHLRKDERFSSVVVAGESAGAYVACLAAKGGTQADAYVFLGAFCGPADEVYSYNFGRLAEYAATSAERLAWAEKRCRYELALGRHYREMFQQARDGREVFALKDGDFTTKIDLVRRREELDLPPREMFRNIRSPALAIAGDEDCNVPPAHAELAARTMRDAGNERATHKLIAGVDHSFQRVPTNEDEQIRERFELTNFRRPYEAKAYHEILQWLRATVPTPAELFAEQVELAAARPTVAPAGLNVVTGEIPELVLRAKDGVEIDQVTDESPERIQLAPGIEIIADITAAKKTAGVETLEGRIGPLILGEGSQAHFIDMPAGMFVEEHPHSTESIIYTVRGRWVLCSQGRRHVMKPGTLFRFGPNIPTGYEVPFDENAFILIFKGDRITKSDADFIQYLKGMADRLRRDHQAGTPFLLKELPADHPARVFANQIPKAP